MAGAFFAPAAIFQEIDFTFNLLFIFARPIIDPLAILASQFD